MPAIDTVAIVFAECHAERLTLLAFDAQILFVGNGWAGARYRWVVKNVSCIMPSALMWFSVAFYSPFSFMWVLISLKINYRETVSMPKTNKKPSTRISGFMFRCSHVACDFPVSSIGRWVRFFAYYPVFIRTPYLVHTHELFRSVFFFRHVDSSQPHPQQQRQQQQKMA